MNRTQSANLRYLEAQLRQQRELLEHRVMQSMEPYWHIEKKYRSKNSNREQMLFVEYNADAHTYRVRVGLQYSTARIFPSIRLAMDYVKSLGQWKIGLFA